MANPLRKMVSRGGSKSPLNRGGSRSPLSTLGPVKKHTALDPSFINRESVSGEILKNYTINGANGISLGAGRNQQGGIRNKVAIQTKPAAITADKISKATLL